MAVIVRPAADTDGPGLYRVFAGLRAHNASVDSRTGGMSIAETELAGALPEILSRPSSAVLVADDGGDVVGFLSGGIEHNVPDRLPERLATIGYLYVDESRRRQGVGRQLFDAFARWAMQQDGVSHVEMPVLAADAQAAAFWTAMGFTPFIQRLWAPLGDGPV